MFCSQDTQNSKPSKMAHGYTFIAVVLNNSEHSIIGLFPDKDARVKN